ncbi:MAG: hypothetical protein P0Y65_15780 [Candidatus Devosia phytovorans]|uniref:Uncharacterized protein n=1 Tax=Candidatus Devosia phytovorans TaxID=3121372 RepID=A0AAJ6B0M2_9HYPH|nr:hypothetical protein [Devosia sp.]WEK03638.1 MAG: hypothetical protein P0Y65_15780 [Devosia sp.]
MAGATPLHSRPSAPAMVGLIESIGQLGATELFVGGWAKEQAGQGAIILVVTADRAVEARWFAAWSDRPDVGPDTGFAGLLELDAPILAEAVLAIQLSAGTGLGLYKQRLLLDERQASARLRATRPRPQHDSAPLAEAASRYDGTDSIATSPLPIRLGVDDCVALDGGAMLVSGWLFDPEGLVRQVELSAGTEALPISQDWLVRRRADVLASISLEPRFALYAGSGDHCGFTALVSGLDTIDDPHLTLVTASGNLHAPLDPRRGNARVLLTGLLNGIDPELPSSMDVAEKLVAPVLARLEPASPVILRRNRKGLDRDAPLALVIGCHGDAHDVATHLATLAAEPLSRNTPIIIAAPAMELAASERDILQRSDFFGLRVTLVFGEAIADHVDALALGVLAAQAERLCLLACDIVPDAMDWLALLTAAHPIRPSVLVPNQFDHASFGPQSSQRERARLHPGADCCLASRDTLLDAFDSLGTFLDRTSKSRAWLAALEQRLQRVDALDVDMLNGSATHPSASLLRRADAAAAKIRADRA